jgi:putative transposase
MHTDRGCQYANKCYRALIRPYGMTAATSRKGNCWDNAGTERFFKTQKVAREYQVRDPTRVQARLDIVDWIEGYCNRERLHSSIGYRTPVAGERRLVAA